MDQAIESLYRAYDRIFPVDLKEKVSFDKLKEIEEAIKQPIVLSQDRNKLLYQWGVLVSIQTHVKAYLVKKEVDLAKLAAETEIAIRGREGKTTEAQVKALIAATPEYNVALEATEYVKVLAEHLKELKQLMWTRKETMLDMSEEERRSKSDDQFASRLI